MNQRAVGFKERLWASLLLRRGGALLVGAVAAVCLLGILSAGCTPSALPVPQPDLSAHDPDVAALIRSLAQRALDHPASAEDRGNLGLALEAQGMLGTARAAYAQADTLDGSDPRWLYHRARMDAAAGDLEGAIEAMDQVRQRAPDYAPASWQPGFWLLDSGRLDDAALLFDAVLAKAPDDLAAGVGRARVYLADANPDAAVALVSSAIQSRPDDPYLYHLLATAYRELGRQDEALVALKRARPSGPAFEDPWRDAVLNYKIGYAADLKRAMRFLGQGNVAQALPLLERLRRERPEDVTVLSNLGAAYLDAGRLDQSKQALMTALGHAPDHVASLLNVSALLEREGRMQAALEHVDRAIALNPFLGQAHLARARLLAQDGQIAAARAALGAARRLHPGDPRLAALHARLEAAGATP